MNMGSVTYSIDSRNAHPASPRVRNNASFYTYLKAYTREKINDRYKQGFMPNKNCLNPTSDSFLNSL